MATVTKSGRDAGAPGEKPAAEACVIVNPNAGSATELAVLAEALEKILPGARLVVTEEAGHAQALARDAVRAGVRTVVAAGGDGTLNEVVNGLAGAFDRVRLALLPLGTGNDFARSIGVPADLEGALAVLAGGRMRRIDVGRVTFGDGAGRYFLNMSAGGFSGIINEKMEEDDGLKERWGPLSYLRCAVEALPELAPFDTTVVLDGGERLALEAWSVVVSNGSFVASGIPVAPQAVLDDGLLDLMIAPQTTFPRLAVLLPQVLLGRHTESDQLVFRKARRIEIDSDPPMAFNVDGELAGEVPAVFEVLPRALEMVVGEIPEPREP